jgi:hypothetical protein
MSTTPLDLDFFLVFFSVPKGMKSRSIGTRNTLGHANAYLNLLCCRSWASLNIVLVLVTSKILGANSFTSGTAPTARIGAGLTVSPNGILYLFGGNDSSSADNSLFAFEPLENVWKQLDNNGASAPGARVLSILWMALDGHLYLFGGYDPSASCK